MARNEVVGEAGPAGDDKKKVSDQVNPSHVRQLRDDNVIPHILLLIMSYLKVPT